MTVKELKAFIAAIDTDLDDKQIWYVDFGGHDTKLVVHAQTTPDGCKPDIYEDTVTITGD
jgi:hypothetical protein